MNENEGDDLRFLHLRVLMFRRCFHGLLPEPGSSIYYYFRNSHCCWHRHQRNIPTLTVVNTTCVCWQNYLSLPWYYGILRPLLIVTKAWN